MIRVDVPLLPHRAKATITDEGVVVGPCQSWQHSPQHNPSPDATCDALVLIAPKTVASMSLCDDCARLVIESNQGASQ